MDWVGLPSEKVSCSGYLWRFPISARQDGSLIWGQRALTIGLKQILSGLFVSALSLVALFLLMRRLLRDLHDYTARVSAEIDSLNKPEQPTVGLSADRQSGHDLKELQIIRDAVERLRLQNEALARTRELTAAADARSRLAQQVAHDIRSPLAAMNALLSISTNLPEEEALLLRSAASRVREIADDLLQNTRPQLSHNPERVIQEGLRMGHLLRSLISETSLVYRERPQLSFSLQLEGDSAEIHVPVAVSELRRAISNLLSNAAESIDGPGKVAVRLAHEQQMLVISVSDTGCGIPEYIRDRLGSAGYSYGKSGGNGLGLHQVVTFAESAGGRVEIQSVVQHGTTVSVFIPCD
jgi:signal transduction histidine kinase